MSVTNCGECLYNKTEITALVNGVCPKCGADYRATMDAFSIPMTQVPKRVLIPALRKIPDVKH